MRGINYSQCKMAEQIQKEIPEEIKKKMEKEKHELAYLVRIMSTDILGDKNIYSGLKRIKGVSFAISNAICLILNLDKNKRVKDLTKDEIKQIEDLIKNLKIPTYLMNRRNDLDTGEDKHLSTSDLDLRKEFDIKRLKKIKSYRGLRHNRGLPVRGQRTKSHFRKKGKNKAIGVKTKKK